MRTVDLISVLALATVNVLGSSEIQGISLPSPTRELEWKDVNFLSISDTHGELLSPATQGYVADVFRLATRPSTCKLLVPWACIVMPKADQEGNMARTCKSHSFLLYGTSSG